MTAARPLLIDGNTLTVEDVVAVARENREVRLAAAARERMAASHAHVQTLLRPQAPPVYGINTGFGIFANRPVASQDAARLSRNLIITHAVAVGAPFKDEVVRAAMLVRANALALGHSGVRPELAQTLLDMLNARVHPVVPQQGSLGSSGDLAQLSHMALVLTTDDADREDESGQVSYRGKVVSGKAAMHAATIPRLVLGAKEGLALNNGATFSAALATLTLFDAENLVRNAELSLALVLEALLGVSDAFDPRLHSARRHSGQAAVAANMRSLLAGSTFMDAGGRVQDPYSLRCAPQVLGPVRDTLRLLRTWVSAEINAATDNPLIFPEEPSVNDRRAFDTLSGGNFHGEVVSMAMDYLGIALAEVGALAERQIHRMVHDRYSYGLSPMLVSSAEAAGLNSGLMMPHYTTASLVLENQTLAHPDSVHSLPTSAGQEDHNANSLTAARHARRIVDNVAHILAVEFYTAAQAIDLRTAESPAARLAPPTRAAYDRVRQEVRFIENDRLYQPEILRVRALVENGELVRIVANAGDFQFI
ncbi:MAG: histidine ammonia-lyase [Anaerolineales bacterium]|jgi:histidine ammonia-lyase|nr:histidine ammonia-lyase [Anaerolineales bacterium]HJN40852.1 histidine ammonia-lyase [Anaerolineales bacterium]|tara:strand:- start:1478 stop:3085 length:1608 start_codon:yes stop_codon:yes gene_type:complete